MKDTEITLNIKQEITETEQLFAAPPLERHPVRTTDRQAAADGFPGVGECQNAFVASIERIPHTCSRWCSAPSVIE